jgi:hypothetical protein
VAVGADKRVGIGDGLAVLIGIGPDGLGQIFKVHLVTDAGAGGHNAKVVERALTPFEELVALHVALVFTVDVHLERAGIAEFVDGLVTDFQGFAGIRAVLSDADGHLSRPFTSDEEVFALLLTDLRGSIKRGWHSFVYYCTQFYGISIFHMGLSKP